ncbi:WGR domain-containing protein [Acuticoccus sp. MNP-M23]|uniref:WGR domain-containing protein n=1 Tax=Acuticoccus sp. MNP-M23 TaxID=3072793 RepID=UPI002815509B|nr:WGR domain-containing protein [Acuticoccus sp. MNP-M23]WMS44521.1 WGR domain-containing protein [Acuticoccus sp. MNP-M23]
MNPLELFHTGIRLWCINPANNKRRFYALSVQRTLFGGWALVREWDRIGVSCRLRCDLYPSAGPATDAFLNLVRKKVRRRYETVGTG